jgi:hypothetical protein
LNELRSNSPPDEVEVPSKTLRAAPVAIELNGSQTLRLDAGVPTPAETACPTSSAGAGATTGALNSFFAVICSAFKVRSTFVAGSGGAKDGSNGARQLGKMSESSGIANTPQTATLQTVCRAAAEARRKKEE